MIQVHKDVMVEQIASLHVNDIIRIVQSEDYHTLDAWIGDLLRRHYGEMSYEEVKAIHDTEFNPKDEE